MSSEAGRLISPAWLLTDVRSWPEVLSSQSGRLSFTTPGRETVCDEPVEAVTDIAFPWYWFSGGFRARVGDTRRRISFLAPR